MAKHTDHSRTAFCVARIKQPALLVLAASLPWALAACGRVKDDGSSLASAKASGGGNVVQNGSFESGLSPWSFLVNHSAKATQKRDKDTKADGSAAELVDVSRADQDTPWDVQLSSNNFAIKSGQQLTITFRAKAEAVRPLQYVVQKSRSPYTEYAHSDISLTTDWQVYTLVQKVSSSDSSVHLAVNFAGDKGKVWIDAVSVTTGANAAPTQPSKPSSSDSTAAGTPAPAPVTPAPASPAPAPVTPAPAAPTPASPSALPAAIAGSNYHMVWSDDFNGTSVDSSKWNSTGPWDGSPVSSSASSFSYSAANNKVADGSVSIMAQKSGSSWRGGILSTDKSYTFAYGYIEVRAKLPAGQGVWPAIWLYGGSTADELDVMEFLGGDVATVYQTIHYPGGQNQVHPTASDWTAQYHTYAMKWEPGAVTFYIDDKKTGGWTANIPSRKMYIMLNSDVGAAGDWGGAADGSTPSPNYFSIDYVHVYQQ